MAQDLDVEGFADSLLAQALREGPPGSTSARVPLSGVSDNVLAFVHAVDWTEPWIVCLLAAHVVLWTSAVALRRDPNYQATLFFSMCAAVAVSEPLNSFARDNWRSFSGQNYFNGSGLFAAVVWAGPMLALLSLQTINALFLAGELLIKVKRRDLKDLIKKGKGNGDGEGEGMGKGKRRRGGGGGGSGIGGSSGGGGDTDRSSAAPRRRGKKTN